MPKEATITINGQPLSYAQSMTVRVAIASFLVNQDHNKRHEPDLHTAIDDLYIARAGEVQKLIIDEITKK